MSTQLNNQINSSELETNLISPIKKESIFILGGKYGAGKSIASKILKDQNYEFLTSYTGYALDFRYIKRSDGKFEIEPFSGRFPRPNENNSNKLDVFKNGIENPLSLIPEDKRVIDRLENGLSIQELEKLTQEHKAKYTPEHIDKSKLSDAEKMYEFLDLEELNKKVKNNEVLITASIPSPKEIGKFGNGIRCYSLNQIEDIKSRGKKICCECDDIAIPGLIKILEDNLPSIEAKAIILSPTMELASAMLRLREGENASARISGNEKNHNTLTDPNKNQEWIKLTQEGKIKKIIITSRVADRDIVLKQKDEMVIEVKKGQEFSVKKTGEIVVNNTPKLNEEKKNTQYITKFIQLNELKHEAQYQFDLADYNYRIILSSPENRNFLRIAETNLENAKDNLKDLGEYGIEDWNEIRNGKNGQEMRNNKLDKDTNLDSYNEELLYFDQNSKTKSTEIQIFLQTPENKLNLRMINARKEFEKAKQEKLELQNENIAGEKGKYGKFLETRKDLGNLEFMNQFLKKVNIDKNSNPEKFANLMKVVIKKIEKENLADSSLLAKLEEIKSFDELINNFKTGSENTLEGINRSNQEIFAGVLRKMIEKHSEKETKEKNSEKSEIKKSKPKMPKIA